MFFQIGDFPTGIADLHYYDHGSVAANHRAVSFFNRHGRVNAVLVVEVDDGHPEALQACIAGRADIFRLAVDAGPEPSVA